MKDFYYYFMHNNIVLEDFVDFSGKTLNKQHRTETTYIMKWMLGRKKRKGGWMHSGYLPIPIFFSG